MPKEKESRTYRLEGRVIKWIDEFAEEQDESKSGVVNRAIKVYAAKLSQGEINDPKWKDQIDKRFEREQ